MPGIVFAATLILLTLLFVIIWRMGQRRRNAIPQLTTWSLQKRVQALRKVESEIGLLQALRRKPLYPMLFLFIGTAGMGTFFFLAANAPSSNEHSFGAAAALFFFVFYLVWTGAFLRLWMTGGWQRYVDSYLERAESLKARILSLSH
jgi:F0F1-type ATP synthase membrane subunit a